MIRLALIAALLAPPTDEEPVDTRWYGWQTLLTDAGAVGFAALAGAHGSADALTNSLAAASAVLYFAGGPAVHLGHRRGGTALGDFGLRVGIPLGGGLLVGTIVDVAAGRPSPRDDCPACGFAIGFLIGAGLGGLTAAILDASWLAREPVSPSGPQIAPSVSWMKGRDGAEHPAVGLLAAF